jgi:hypothetical protein
MRFDVPFREQESEYDCGPVSLQMATGFLGDEKDLNRIKEVLDYVDGDAVYTIQLATAACQLGFSADFFTADPFSEHEGDFYDKHAIDKDNQELYDEAEEAGVTVKFQNLELDEVLDLLTTDSIPVVLIDWNEVKGREGYQGHLIPVVGTTEEEVLIHEPSSEEGDFMEINREKFRQARNSEGTDHDVAVIKKSDI